MTTANDVDALLAEIWRTAYHNTYGIYSNNERAFRRLARPILEAALAKARQEAFREGWQAAGMRQSSIEQMARMVR